PTLSVSPRLGLAVAIPVSISTESWALAIVILVIQPVPSVVSTPLSGGWRNPIRHTRNNTAAMQLTPPGTPMFYRTFHENANECDAAPSPGTDRGSRARQSRQSRLRRLPSRRAADAGLSAAARAQSPRSINPATGGDGRGLGRLRVFVEVGNKS